METFSSWRSSPQEDIVSAATGCGKYVELVGLGLKDGPWREGRKEEGVWVGRGGMCICM